MKIKAFTDEVNIPPRIIDEVYDLLISKNTDCDNDEKRTVVENYFNDFFNKSHLDHIPQKFHFGKFNDKKYYAIIKKQTQSNSYGSCPYNIMKIIQSNLLFDMVSFPNETSFLNEIAKKALAGEPWTSEMSNIPIENGEKREYDILRDYLNYTYLYLNTQKVFIEKAKDDKQYQLFNTGLVDKYFGYIYLVFEKTEDKLSYSFSQASNDENAAKLNLIFGKARPDCVIQHLCHKSNQHETEEAQKELFILLPPAEDFYYGSDHVLIENIDRFPLSILERAFYGKVDLVKVINQIKATNELKQIKLLYEDLKKKLSNDESALRTLNQDFKGALDCAKKRWQWNIKTAVPIWYHEGGKIQHLLPIDFASTENTENIDVVAVIDVVDNQYRLSTILTKRMAYVDARLLCRPSSDWLYIHEDRCVRSDKNLQTMDDIQISDTKKSQGDNLEVGEIIEKKIDKKGNPYFKIKTTAGKFINAFENKNKNEFNNFQEGDKVLFQKKITNNFPATAILKDRVEQ